MLSARGFVTLVGAGPGDPDLITLRGWKALQEASVVLYDSLVDPHLLDDVTANRVYVGKRCGAHTLSQESIISLMVSLARKGERVVRLKGGEPSVLGRAGEEALALAAHGIPFDIVPGVSSATGVPIVVGIPVTHRDVADSFLVATAHRRADRTDLSIPAYHPRTTLVLLMARSSTPLWRDQLLAQGYPPSLPVAFVSAGCTDRERVLVSCVRDAAKDIWREGLGSPVLAVIGRVVELRERIRPTRVEDRWVPEEVEATSIGVQAG
jgi:uroporphyrin-III C-methyltransferase/precorrin-2 dehydrogenase/sirohydrochlorin ferrochelatase